MFYNKHYEKKCIIIARTLAFVIGLVAIFVYVQYIVTPHFTTPSGRDGNAYRTIKTFDNLDDNAVSVVFLGTSHCYCAISPIRLYDKYGIVSYNLSTPGQPIETSYYLLKKLLKKQSPVLIVMDAGVVYKENTEIESRYRWILDSMEPSIEKVELARYCYDNGITDSIYESVFPILRFHSRWDELNRLDFIKPKDLENSINLGYVPISQISPATLDIFTMNQIREDIELEYEYLDTNIEWLNKVKELCKKNNIELLLIKVPSISDPRKITTAWTYDKYEYISDWTSDNNICFLDLQYEDRLPIDWSTETWDNGRHLNNNGAIKVTDYVGEYIYRNYNVGDRKYDRYDEYSSKYKIIDDILSLQSETKLQEYLEILQQNKYKFDIFISFSSGVYGRLSDAEIELLHMLLKGVNLDNNIAYLNSFASVASGGDVLFAQGSNDKQVSFSGDIDNHYVHVESSGLYYEPNSSIVIDDVEYSNNLQGINIVVMEKNTGMVVDAVSFDTFDSDRVCIHTDVMAKLYAFWDKYVEIY